MVTTRLGRMPLVFGGAILLSLGLVPFFCRSTSDARTERPADATIAEPGQGDAAVTDPKEWSVATQRAQWIDHLEHGNPTRFVARDKTIDVVPADVTLRPEEIARVRSNYQALLGTQIMELQELQASMSSPSDQQLLKEASLQQGIARIRAVMRRIENSKYVVLDKSADFPKTIKDGIVLFNNIVTRGDKAYDVVFFIDYNDDAELAAAVKRSRNIADYYRFNVAVEFNQQPLDRRKAAIAEHVMATDKLRHPPPGLTQRDLMTWQRALGMKLLPSFLVINRHTYEVAVR